MTKAAKRQSVANADEVRACEAEVRDEASPTSEPIDDQFGEDDGLIYRLHHYNVSRARFELALTESGFGPLLRQEQYDLIEARRAEAVKEMESHLRLLEIEVQHRSPRTVLGCAELLRTTETILASQERSQNGACSKGNVRKLILAAIEGLDQVRQDTMFDHPTSHLHLIPTAAPRRSHPQPSRLTCRA
jgi:hypothetical protein